MMWWHCNYVRCALVKLFVDDVMTMSLCPLCNAMGCCKHCLFDLYSKCLSCCPFSRVSSGRGNRSSVSWCGRTISVRSRWIWVPSRARTIRPRRTRCISMTPVCFTSWSWHLCCPARSPKLSRIKTRPTIPTTAGYYRLLFWWQRHVSLLNS